MSTETTQLSQKQVLASPPLPIGPSNFSESGWGGGMLLGFFSNTLEFFYTVY